MAVIDMHHNLAVHRNSTKNTTGKKLNMADTTTNCGRKLCIKSKTRSEGNRMMDIVFDIEMSTAIKSYVEEKEQQILEFNKGQTLWVYIHVTLCNWAGQAVGIGYVLYMQMDKMEQSNIHKVQKQGHESQPKEDCETHSNCHQMKQVRRSEAER
eukprot:11564014-Heterocapsa_arctica.AAC.1